MCAVGTVCAVWYALYVLYGLYCAVWAVCAVLAVYAALSVCNTCALCSVCCTANTKVQYYCGRDGYYFAFVAFYHMSGFWTIQVRALEALSRPAFVTF